MNIIGKYGSVSDSLVDKVEDIHEDAEDAVEAATDNVEDLIEDTSSTIDMTNVPAVRTIPTSIGVPAEVNHLAADVSGQIKAIPNDAQSVMQQHVDSVKRALDSAGASAMLAGMYASVSRRQFNMLHMLLAVVVTVVFVVIMFSIFGRAARTSPAQRGARGLGFRVFHFIHDPQPVSVQSIFGSGK